MGRHHGGRKERLYYQREVEAIESFPQEVECQKFW